MVSTYRDAAPLKEKPENFNLLYRLGVSLDNIGEHEKAIEAFGKALELRPDEAKVHRSMGFSFEQSGDSESALIHFKRANELGGEKGSGA